MGAIALALGLGLYYSKVECSPMDCNGEHEVCENTLLSYRCNCKGYDRTDDSEPCFNYNQWVCLQDCNNENMYCKDNGGSYNCVCKSGFKPADDGESCTNIDECHADHVNDFEIYKCKKTNTMYPHCIDNEGSYSCVCKSGFNATDYCSNIDECNPSNFNNPEIYKCNKKNTIEPHCIDKEGSYCCVCKKGFNATDFCSSCNKGYELTDDGKSCNNIDECNSSNINNPEIYKCDKKNTMEPHCIDNEGSYSCVCKIGFNDIDHCNSCMNGFIEHKVNETHSECVGNVVQ